MPKDLSEMTQNRPQRTFRTAALLTLAAGLLVPAAAPAQLTPNAEPIDSIVALVDEDVILRSELDLAVAGIVERVRASGDAMPPMNL
ncbi:MAG: hypothetical protein HKP02_13200, partial [Xanthomonadales bacterium]|nr:hypothetical protein [Xanthomonadales bacterium]